MTLRAGIEKINAELGCPRFGQVGISNLHCVLLGFLAVSSLALTAKLLGISYSQGLQSWSSEEILSLNWKLQILFSVVVSVANWRRLDRLRDSLEDLAGKSSNSISNLTASDSSGPKMPGMMSDQIESHSRRKMLARMHTSPVSSGRARSGPLRHAKFNIVQDRLCL